MNPESPPQTAFNLEFVSFVLFRHKWKILLFSLAGLVAATVLYSTATPLYQSRSKLLVRYVTDTRVISARGLGDQVRSPDSQGENIINSELEILSSWDLALKVVDGVGIDKVLGKTNGANARVAAAGLIVKNLTTDVPKKSNVIILTFSHLDPEVAQKVLSVLIDRYLEKHLEIHTAIGAYDFLTQQTDQLRSRLMQSEEELDKLKHQAGVTSLSDAKTAVSSELTRLRQTLNETEAEIAERQAKLKEIEKFQTSNRESTTTNAEPILNKAPKELAYYKMLSEHLNALRAKEIELLAQYTDQNSRVKAIRTQIEETEKLKSELELKEPELAMVNITSPATKEQTFDPILETAQLAAFDAKAKVLKSQLERVRNEATTIDQFERSIVQLQRKKDLEETNYRYFSASLEQARIDNALESGKVSNISVVQSPSAAVRMYDKIRKPMAMVLAFGILGGIGLAFLIETFFDQTIKRPSEVSTRLQIPLYLTIQESAKKRRTFWSRGNKGKLKSLVKRDGQAVKQPETACWERSHPLRSYYEALRDRMVLYFEQENMVHKPKMIGITSCGERSGVTTIATALAAVLSETGDGKVLLVDLTLEHGAAHPFFGGKPLCGLLDVLENDHGHCAQVFERLDVVSANGANGSALAVRSKKFTDLIPKLKATDYDYIIFDLPRVTPTSVTLRLAGFMDKVLLVIKAEETNRNVLEHACGLLKESGASVSAILSNTRRYLPKWLHPEL